MDMEVLKDMLLGPLFGDALDTAIDAAMSSASAPHNEATQAVACPGAGSTPRSRFARRTR